MKTTSNLKDTLTTICGILIVISGGLLTAEKSGAVFPSWVAPVASGLGVIAGSVIAVLTGKNPDGSTKSVDQVAAQNAQSKANQDEKP